MNRPACRIALTALIAGLLVCAGAPAQEVEVLGHELKAEEVEAESEALKRVLAGPRERAFRQVLADARIELDPTLQNEFSYDLIVQYDPGRYRDPQAGLYPMTFENQLILWGKRIALFTRSNRWRAGRFYLHNISTGNQAWMFASETRHLYPPPSMKITYPPVAGPDNAAGLQAWLKLIYGVDTGTDLRRMSRWFRLMRFESRDDVQRRALDAQQAAAMREQGQ